MQSIQRASFRITACVRQIHSLSRQIHPSGAALCRRWNQQHVHLSSALPLPHVEGEEKEYSPKIEKLVEEIGNLTLLEVADLNELLKKTLNISDAPMMAMGTAAAAPQADEDEVMEEQAPAQVNFTVKLLKYDETKKVPLIKEIKANMEGMNLVQAKKFVEGVPQDVKADISKEDAEKLAAALEAVGGTVEIK